MVDENYALRIPDGISLDVAAPLLCAGITLYSPLKHWGAGPGKKVAIVGMGGLGHMGVQLAHALGAEVTVLSQSLSKQADGLALGADHYYATSDRQTFRDLRRSFDLIISTVGADIDVDAYLSLLRFEGSLVFVGLPENKQSFRVFSLTGARRNLSGSNIGGIRETQEMLDFCAEHGHRLGRRDHHRRRRRQGLRPRGQQRRPLPLRHRHVHDPGELTSRGAELVSSRPTRLLQPTSSAARDEFGCCHDLAATRELASGAQAQRRDDLAQQLLVVRVRGADQRAELAEDLHDREPVHADERVDGQRDRGGGQRVGLPGGQGVEARRRCRRRGSPPARSARPRRPGRARTPSRSRAMIRLPGRTATAMVRPAGAW